MTNSSPFIRVAVGAVAIMALEPSAALAADDDAELEAVRARMAAMFEQIEPEHVNEGPIDGWYKIQKGSIVAYVSADGRYLMQGDLIDLETDVNLTEVSRNDARRDIMASLDDQHTIMFSPADAKHTVTVFTDVECTYCRRLHSQIDEYMGHGIAVRYVLYPRNGPASRAWSTSEEVWCSSDRNKALTAAKLDREFQTVACDASVIQDNYLLGRKIGFSDTPAVVLESGELIGGYMPPDALAQHLERTAIPSK
ncbi:MAG: DsbC family protein [Woeseiaceae bacterium]